MKMKAPANVTHASAGNRQFKVVDGYIDGVQEPDIEHLARLGFTVAQRDVITLSKATQLALKAESHEPPAAKPTKPGEAASAVERAAGVLGKAAESLASTAEKLAGDVKTEAKKVEKEV